MKVVLINPPLCVQSNDPFTTGIVYMPIALASAGAVLRQAGFEVQVIDVFGIAPRDVSIRGKFWFFGLSLTSVPDQGISDAGAVVIYANHIMSHAAVCELTRVMKACYSSIPIVILENTQAVTGYSLKHVADEFYHSGADFILTGEPEERIVHLMNFIRSSGGLPKDSSIDGVGGRGYYHSPRDIIHDLDRLPFPAWDLFPLENYWSLGFAHGPLSARKYLSLLTSRGCPYACRFCVVPATNHCQWRARTAGNVVDEIEFWNKEYEVSEFHWEDVNPTVSDERIRAICREILDRGLSVTWKLVSGTKVETLRDEETIDLMARAGCRYISISPETGSPRLLKAMNKPFDLAHAVRMAKRMVEKGIRCQACFVLGFPGEEAYDRLATVKLVRDLTRLGVDEVAFFIVTPVPGSQIAGQFTGWHSLSELSFSPSWRKDYAALSHFRMGLYARFLLWRLWHHPFKTVRQVWNFLRRCFETKMEMVPYRALCLMWYRKNVVQ